MFGLSSLISQFRRVAKPSGRLEGDLSEFMAVYQKCQPFTMTSLERMYCLWEATKYAEQIEGDIVECGVWKGGSCMLAALTLSNQSKRIWLYDTFEGMPEPTDKDVSHNIIAKDYWKTHKEWCYASLDEVTANMRSTGYSNVAFVKGKVEDTLQAKNPSKVSLLRIDTDWYSPTLCVLEQLFPKLSVGGVLIMDDYGYWKGAKQAADEYFAKNGVRIFLQKIDHAGVVAVKV